jgi:N-acetylglucosaminyldiphosphoundecaprenol N-acetyl-beta-D-mannosaminyltransferase
MPAQSHSTANPESALPPDTRSGAPHGLQAGPMTFDFSTIHRGGPSDTGPIAVTAPDRDGLMADLEARLAAGRGFSLATLNLDHLVKFDRDPAFRRAYAAQTHVTADGNPVVWLCRLAGQDVSLIPGSELVEPIAGMAARQGVAVALVGSTEASLSGAAAALGARYPGLEIAARLAPPMGFDPEGPDADDIIAALRASGARVCFLALGAPKQEIFAARAARALPQTGFLSIGAGLDFLSGAQTRAPAIVRRLALEWLWRLAGSPRRLLGRYASCFAVLPPAVRAAVHARRSGGI